MNVLEILEEIDKLKENCLLSEFENGYTAGALDVANAIKKAIHNNMDEVKDANVPNNDSWIPVEDGLPEDLEKVLVWYEYFRYGEYNCMFETYGMGWQLDGHWSGDVSGVKARCIAWQPLPEPYKPVETKPAKNTQQEMEDFWRDK